MPAFLDELRPPAALVAAVIRSPFARGLLRELTLPPLPEGCCALAAADIPGDPVLECLETRVPALAAEKILHPGQPLALLAAPDADLLAELTAGVRIAVDARTPLPGWPYGQEQPPGWSWRRGEPEAAFAAAAHIVEGEYRCESRHFPALDPVGGVAEWDGRTLLLHALTTDPFDLRRQVARLLDLPERRIRVRAAAGGPLEGRRLPALLAAAHAALLAWRSGRNIRLIYEPRDQALWGTASAAAVVQHRTALGADGLPIGARVSLRVDAGAFVPCGSRALEEAARSAEPTCPGLELAAVWTSSSRPPADPTPATEAVCFAAELHVSHLQEVAGLDPYEWRRKLAGRGRAGEVAVLEQVVALADFRRRYAACAAARRTRDERRSPRGIGLAVCSQQEAGSGSMKLALARDGSLSIHSTLVAVEPWLAELFRRQAARLLEVEPERIRVEPADTRDTPPGPAGSVGRALGPGLRLLEQCCREVRRRGRPVTVTRRLTPAGKAPERSWAATVVEVEADPATLEVRCRGVWLVLDAGRVEEPLLCRSFAAGEVLRALGRVDPSRRYAGLRPLPALRVEFLPCGGRAAYRSWDRLPALGVAPAFAAAASQATGLFLDQLPLTPEVLQQCLESE